MNITPYEISLAFEKRTAAALRGTQVQFVSSWQEIKVDAHQIIVLQSFVPGQVYREEKGPDYLSRRVGIYKVTFSVPRETNPREALNLSSVIEGLYRGEYLYTDTGHRIACDEPYTTIVGRDEATKRFILYTDVPWHVFFNNATP